MAERTAFYTTWSTNIFSCLRDTRGELNIGKLIEPTENKIAKQKPGNSTKINIGGTTYLISSFFKEESKGTVIDKISRLIERETTAILVK